MESSIKVVKFPISGLLRITFPTFPDDRGFFKEIVRISEIEKATGKEFRLKQANHSRSAKNTLRGIHIAPWNKISYVTKGKVQMVIVDCRNGSPTFGQHESFMLGDGDRSCVFIPAGCGNSYLVLSEDADYIYLTDQEWAPNIEKNIAWNDPTLAIKWELEGEPILSEKDKNNPSLTSIK
jgi:dTDP-4-dehydrorhamnose 3,5-epimerase